MEKSIKTHLYCYDPHKSFSEDIKKKFDDTERYRVLSFQNADEFMSILHGDKKFNHCKIVLIGLNDSHEQYDSASKLIDEIKNFDNRTGIILICPPEKKEEISKTIKKNIDAYIPRNSNSILRIHNAVKKIVSEHNISIFRRKRNISLAVLSFLILLSLLFLIITYLKLPDYF
jgi:DNA-binding NarL/FixJ family response regulator